MDTLTALEMVAGDIRARIEWCEMSPFDEQIVAAFPSYGVKMAAERPVRKVALQQALDDVMLVIEEEKQEREAHLKAMVIADKVVELVKEVHNG